MLSSLVNKAKRHILNRLAWKFDQNFSRPELIYIKLTEKCNFRCQHCDIWKSEKHTELNLLEWEKILADLKHFKSDLQMTISGGEPFLYPHFWPLLDLLAKHKIGVNINTNGSLIDEVVADRLAGYKNICKIEISLYTLDASKHDNLRQTPGAFSKAERALKYLLEARAKHQNKFEILVALLLNKDNIDEVPKFIKHHSAVGVWTTIQSLDSNIQTLAQEDFFQNSEDPTNHPLWIHDQDKVISVFDQIITLKKQGALIYNRLEQLEKMREYNLGHFITATNSPCLAGHNNLIISSQGDAFFCFKGPKIGNLLKDSATSLWKSVSARKVRKQIKQCQKACRMMNCNYDVGLWSKIWNKLKKAR